MSDAEKRLGDDVPIAVLIFSRRAALINPKLKNVKFNSISLEFYLRDVQLEN